MNSIEFGKKCRPYNVQYRDVFGYVPCRLTIIAAKMNIFKLF